MAGCTVIEKRLERVIMYHSINPLGGKFMKMRERKSQTASCFIKNTVGFYKKVIRNQESKHNLALAIGGIKTASTVTIRPQKAS